MSIKSGDKKRVKESKELKKDLSRKWCLTINNWEQSDLDKFLSLSQEKKNKFIVGKEFGTENNVPHLQAFIYHDPKFRFSYLKKMWPRAHIEVSEGSIDSNLWYCSKDGDYISSWTEEEIGQACIRHLSIKNKFKDCKYNHKEYQWNANMELARLHICKEFRKLKDNEIELIELIEKNKIKYKF